MQLLSGRNQIIHLSASAHKLLTILGVKLLKLAVNCRVSAKNPPRLCLSDAPTNGDSWWVPALLQGVPQPALHVSCGTGGHTILNGL
uniref:Uncharacterized protein n=1 Tax=Rhipicephalus zambeziensis TaxID=60191 RepID=A0A224Y8E5_9ACAR